LADSPAGTIKATGRLAWWPAIGVHAGLLVVCASCAYTMQPDMFGEREWLAFAALGIVIAGVAACTRGRVGKAQAGRLLLALGATTALALSYEPPLSALPAVSDRVPTWLAQFEPGIGLAGIALALVFWALYRVVARGGVQADPPFVGALLVSAFGVLVLAGIMYLALHGLYDLAGGYGNLLVAYNVVQYTILMLIALEMSGAVGVGGLPHLYVGAAVFIAAARNLLA